MADQYDNSDEGSSDFSSSVASSVIDEKIFLLSSEPVQRLLWKYAGAFMLALFLDIVASMVVYTQIFYYSGFRSLSFFVTYLPVIAILCQHPILALARATAAFISRALAQMQIQIANVYYSHYFFIASIWAVLVPVLFTSWYGALAAIVIANKRQSIDPSLPYFALMTGMSAIFNIVTVGLSPFVRLESRAFVDVTRSGLLSVLNVMFCSISFYIAYMYGQTADEGGLIAAGMGSITAHFFVSIWLAMLVFRKTVLQVSLRGGLKFSIKRLFPINIRIMLQILLFQMVQWYLSAHEDILVMIANMLYGSTYSDYTSMNARRIAFYNYLIMRRAMDIANDGLQASFLFISNYDIIFKRYSRTYKAMIYSFIYMSAITLVICIVFGSLSEPIFRAMQPYFREANDKVILLQKYIQQTGKLSFVIPTFMPAYKITAALMQIEGRTVASILLPLPRIVTTIVLLIITAVVSGDQGDYLLPFPVGDAAAAIIGICMFVFHLYRYRILSSMDTPEGGPDTIVKGLNADGKDLPNVEKASKATILGSDSSSGPGRRKATKNGSSSSTSTSHRHSWGSSSSQE